MKVIFTKDVYNVAQAGDVKEVKDGFARNYLFPQGLAILATKNEIQRLDAIRKRADEHRLKEAKELKDLASALEGRSISVKARAGATGRLYGTVTNATIAGEFSRLIERPVDKKAVEMEEPIRQLGEYEVRIRLVPEISAMAKVVVEPE